MPSVVTSLLWFRSRLAQSARDNSEANIFTADALTQLLRNQHAIDGDIEEVTTWLTENGIGGVASNVVAAMDALDTNALSITDAILRLRKFRHHLGLSARPFVSVYCRGNGFFCRWATGYRKGKLIIT